MAVVQNLNEIYLDGTFYKLKPNTRVQRVKAPGYAPKMNIGAASADARPDVSVVKWSDLSGGIGIQRITEPAHLRSYWRSACNVDARRGIFLPPTLTTTTGTLSARVLVEFGGVVYAATASTLLKYDNTGDTWGSSLGTISTAAIDGGVGLVNGTRYIVFACGTNLSYSTTGAAASFTENAQDCQYLCFWNDLFYGVTNAGQLFYTSDFTTYPNDAVLPTQSGSIRGLIVGPDATGEPIIYAWTTEGLYAHDAANAKFWPVIALPSQEYVGEPTVWRGTLLLPTDQTLLQYEPTSGTVRDISPGGRAGLGVGYTGFIKRIVADAYRVFILVDEDSDPATTGYSFILVYQDGAWHTYMRVADSLSYYDLLLCTAYSAYRLWLSEEDYSRVYYIQAPPSLSPPLDITGWTFYSNQIWSSPWFDAFEADITKVGLRLKIETTGCSSTETVTPTYYINYGASGTALAAITSNGITSLTLGNAGLEFRAFRIDLTLVRGSTTTVTPQVISVTLEYYKVTDATWQFACELDLSVPARDTTSARGVTPDIARKALITSLEKATLLEFTYRDSAKDASETFYVKPTNPALSEQTGLGENVEGRLVLVEV